MRSVGFMVRTLRQGPAPRSARQAGTRSGGTRQDRGRGPGRGKARPRISRSAGRTRRAAPDRSSLSPPRASIRSGRASIVRRRAWARRHRSTRPWSPERSTVGHLPAPEARPVGCTAGTRAGRRRRTRRRPTRRCPSPRAPAGRPPRAPPWPPPRRRPARSRRPRARRRRGGGAPARRRPRSARTAARTRRGRPAPGPRPGRSAARRVRAAAAGGAGRPRSTAANSGSGISTMPAPPPNGLSSTERCGSEVAWRRSCTRTSSRPALAGPPEQAGVGEPVDQVREDGEDVDAHRQSRMPSGGSTCTKRRRRPRRVDAADDEAQRHERARGRARAGRWPGWRRPPPPARGSTPCGSTHSGADQLVDPERVGVAVVGLGLGGGRQHGAGQRLGRLAGVHPGEAHDPSVLMGPRRRDHQRAGRPCRAASRAPGATPRWW